MSHDFENLKNDLLKVSIKKTLYLCVILLNLKLKLKQHACKKKAPKPSFPQLFSVLQWAALYIWFLQRIFLMHLSLIVTYWAVCLKHFPNGKKIRTEFFFLDNAVLRLTGSNWMKTWPLTLSFDWILFCDQCVVTLWIYTTLHSSFKQWSFIKEMVSLSSLWWTLFVCDSL